MATEAERLLKSSGWLPEVLRRADLVAFEDQSTTEGQGASVDDYADQTAEMPDDSEAVDLPASLTADLPESAPPMMAAE